MKKKKKENRNRGNDAGEKGSRRWKKESFVFIYYRAY